MAKSMAISALIVRLRPFGLFWFACNFNSKPVILEFLPIHVFDGFFNFLSILEDLRNTKTLQ
jgi:hypothetical protein